MQPQKENGLDLNTPDLEIFSPDLSVKPTKKPSGLHTLLDKTYVKSVLTLMLLLFLFVSTFLIASRVQQPSFTTSSADFSYLPESQIEIPAFIKPTSCSDLDPNVQELSLLQSYCQGDYCSPQTSQENCETVDVVIFENGFLEEERGQDGAIDCVWLEEEKTCRNKY